MSNGHICNDISEEQREILEFKAARRLRLRNEYLKDAYNPFHTQLENEALLKFQALRQKPRNIPTVQRMLSGMCVVMSIFTLATIMYKKDQAKERDFRSGNHTYLERCRI